MKMEWVERGLTLRLEAESEADLGFIEDLLRPQDGWATWAFNRSCVDWQSRDCAPAEGKRGYYHAGPGNWRVVYAFTLDLAQLRNVDALVWPPGLPTPAGVLPAVPRPAIGRSACPGTASS